MTLAAGRSLTHYEILGPLGAGGMGEVYRARDTRLEREVAIKVLPEELAGDEERLRRFEREAKTLASLNHANLAHVYGIDQVEDTCFIAMELVEGEDLATRLGRGRLPVDEAVGVCRQIAEGLEAAHEAGVVHRDLKPANVRITPEGVVKILDFGLAKPVRPPAGLAETAAAESDSFALTEEGLVLGTPTYMSPEQARGMPVDRRTDIWALGCLLFECLTGRRAFEGESLTDLLASIVGQEPDWSRLPELPARVDELLRRMLTKDPRERLRDAGEARVQLALAPGEPATGSSGRRGRPELAVAVAVVLVGAGVLVGMGLRRGPDAGPSQPAFVGARSDPPICAVVHEFSESDPATGVLVSPDARRIAWTDGSGLHVRELGAPEPRTILARPTISALAWSPDSMEIAYRDQGGIWRVAIEAPVPVRVADFRGWLFSSLQWTSEGRIAYRTKHGVEAVTLDGEHVKLVSLQDPTIAHVDGFALDPGGAGAMVVPHYNARKKIAIELVGDGRREEVVELPAEPKWWWLTEESELLWQTGTTLWGARVSFEELALLEEPRIIQKDWSAKWLSIARDGTLVYLVPEGRISCQLVLIDRTGVVTPLDGRYPNCFGADFSPDGSRFAFSFSEGGRCEVLLHDVERGTSSPWIHRDDGASTPLFLPDGRIGVTPLFPMTGTDIYPASGRTEPEELDVLLLAMTPDGKRRVVALEEGAFLGMTPVYLEEDGAGGERLPLLDAAHAETFCGLSRDAAWMLHTSERSKRREAYLTRFPPGEEIWPVSTDGADRAWFSDDGNEILYWHEQRVFRVALETDPEVRLGAPEPLFAVPPGVVLRAYDGAERFVGIKTPIWGKVFVDTGGLRSD